jgi:hypothetical protein
VETDAQWVALRIEKIRYTNRRPGGVWGDKFVAMRRAGT